MQTGASRARRLRRGVGPSRKPTTTGVALALVGLLLPGGEALGYRFYWRTANDPGVPVAAEGLRWDPAIWGPGRTLRWVIADSPGWTEPWEYRGETREPPFTSREEVVPFVRKALDAWSSLASTDIEWSVAGLGGEHHAERDHVNAVRMHPLGLRASYVDIWEVNGEIVECDVSLTPVHTREPDGRGLEVLIHELGHCIGLTHSAMFPTWDTWPYRYGFQPALWDTDPVMSYGYLPEPGLTPDDIAGASLLRPSRGWLDRVGSITGRVTMAGRAARYVPVFAMQISGEELVASAGAFTNGEGSFAIEGLPPGDYLLAAGTMGDISGNTSLVDRGATLGSTDQYLLDPVRVAAGAETRVPPIQLREGREASPWRSE